MRETPPPRPAGPPHDPTAPGDAPASPHRAAAVGHLARLVQRARPTEALLQRRQPSLFEQVQPGAQARGTDDEPVDAVMSTPLSVHRASEPAAARAAASQRPEPGVTETARRPPAPMPAPHPVTRQELRVPRETLRIDASMRTAPTAPPTMERPARHMVPGQTASSPATGQMAAPQLADGAAAPRPSPTRPREESAATHPRQRAESGGFAPAGRTTAAATAVPLLRPVRALSVLPASLARAAQRAANAQSVRRQQATHAPSPHELPAVQVTIGRIEVRAVAAPAAAERSAKTAPRLGLEQYLRERHGGRR